MIVRYQSLTHLFRLSTIAHRPILMGIAILFLNSCSTVIPISDMKTVNADKEIETLFPNGNTKDCNITRKRMEQITNYIISLNENGRYEPITLNSENDSCGKVSQPSLNSENKDDKKAIELHTNKILNALFSQEQLQTNILIFIHGGLNSPKESRSRAIEESYLISQYKDRNYFPIFINWHSEGLDTYRNQILHVRQGKEASITRGIFTSPLYFLSDTIQAIGRAPATFEKNIARLAKTKFLDDTVSCVSSTQLETVLCEGHTRSNWEKLPRVLKFVPNFIFQLFEALPADSYGKSAWVNMLRRTKILFRNSQEFEGLKSNKLPDDDRNDFNSKGDLAFFLRELKNQIAERENSQSKKIYKVTLVGHSMGTIIANEIVRAFPDLPYEEIVYMAAACSIHDFERSVIPLLKKNVNLKFYNLSLDPHAEAREYTLGGIGPTGSLLEWVDAYYTDPPTVFDMTMGKWQNIASVIHTFPYDVRSQMTFKVFAFDEREQPTKHGELHDTKRCWWQPEYWSKIKKVKGKQMYIDEDLYEQFDKKLKQHIDEKLNEHIDEKLNEHIDENLYTKYKCPAYDLER